MNIAADLIAEEKQRARELAFHWSRIADLHSGRVQDLLLLARIIESRAKRLADEEDELTPDQLRQLREDNYRMFDVRAELLNANGVDRLGERGRAEKIIGQAATLGS